MKKRTKLVLLCGVILFGTCGCSNNEFTGKWYIYEDYNNTSYMYFKSNKELRIETITNANSDYYGTEYLYQYKIDGDKLTVIDDNGNNLVFYYDEDTECFKKNGSISIKYCHKD